MYEDLKIIEWPDPRLKAVSKPVEAFDEKLKALAARMFELMRQHKGVGLAAPQVGHNIRMFVMNATGSPEDDRAYVNPELHEPGGEEEGEEGCLSLPDIRAQILRSRTYRIMARDLEGRPFEQQDSGYVARIWQHEFDHLNGTLILDRMGPLAKLGARKALRELQARWDAAHPPAGRKR
jgi:peptide deformylase